MKRMLAIVSIMCLVLALVPAISLVTSADVVCPQMPLGATNYATKENMEVTGNEPAAYANGGLAIPRRDSFDGVNGYGIVRVNLPDEVTADKGYVLSYWTLEPGDSNFYTVRFFGDTDGNYFELQIGNELASLTQNGVSELERFTLPSTGKALAAKTKTNNLGRYKRVEIYIRPSAAAGKTDVSFFINGEAMHGISCNDTYSLIGDKMLLVLGNKGAAQSVRGLRFYAVDAGATEFEPQVDPIAEITAAPNATAGTGFIDDMNPMAAISAEDMLLPHYDPSGDEPELSTDCPRMPVGSPNFAIGATSTVSNAKTDYDANNGYINLCSSNWSAAHWTLTTTGINPDDDYVVSFVLKRPYSWGQNYQTMITFGSDGANTQKINFTVSENTTYTASDGTVKGMAAATSGAGWTNGVKIDLHMYPNDHGTRTIDVFAGDVLLSRIKNQKILPFVWQVDGASNTSYTEEFCGLRIYKTVEGATAFEQTQAAGQKQAATEPTPGLTDIIGNNWWAKTVAANPTKLYESNEFDLSTLINTETDNAYVISAWMQVGSAVWTNDGTVIFASDTDGGKYNIQLRHPSENSGKFSLNVPGSTGFGTGFLPNGLPDVASAWYKVAVFLRKTGTAGTWSYRIFVNDVEQTALGEKTIPNFVPYLRITNYCAGIRIYKVDPNVNFCDKGFRRSGDTTGSAEDTVPPTVLSAKDGDTFAEDRYITVIDTDTDGINTLKSVTINGVAATSIGHKTYVVPTGTRADYEVVATDEAGNKTSMTIHSNYRPTYEIKISWANMPYKITGVNNGGALNYTGVRTFYAYEGETVTICADNSEAMSGAVKNHDASWSWLSNGTYSFVVDGDRDFVIQGWNNPVLTINIEGEGTVSGVKAGYQPDGYGFTARAIPAAGWQFDHFEFTNNNGTVQSANPSTAFAIGGNSTLKAVFVEAIMTYDVNVNSAVGGYGDGQVYDVEYGTEVTLTAYADDGFVFRYWLINDRIFNGEAVTLAVNGDIHATPVFMAKNADTYTIHFYTADGRLIMTADSATFDAYRDLPAVPARYGYTDNGWDYVWEDGIYSDIDVYPQYTKIGDYYTITVNGGKANKGFAQFETAVTVNADTAEGFVGWKNANGEFVSTSPRYTFFAVQDETLTAIYDGVAPVYTATAIRNALNESLSDETFKTNIVGETHVGEGYVMIERGIVYATGAKTADTLVIGGAGVKKKMSTSTGNGQFMYTLTGAPKGVTITARAYMIVSDGKEQITVYSGLCDCTWTA